MALLLCLFLLRKLHMSIDHQSIVGFGGFFRRQLNAYSHGFKIVLNSFQNFLIKP